MLQRLGSSLVSHLGTKLSDIIESLFLKIKKVSPVVNADDYPTLQDAVDAAFLLSGKEHDASTYSGTDWKQWNSTCKVVDLKGKKYIIDKPLVIKGGVSIKGNGGGVVLSDTFPEGNDVYAIKFTANDDGEPYSGNLNDFILDGNSKNCHGLHVSNSYLNIWSNIKVANIGGTGLTFAGGFGLYLSGASFVCTQNPMHNNISGMRISGSDCQFHNIECRYQRYGVWVTGGGNHRFSKIHVWGLYEVDKNLPIRQNTRMRLCFVVQNSINNKFSQCFADSPSKLDYSMDNLASHSDFINGGIGFLNGENSYGNIYTDCGVFINDEAYGQAGLSGVKQIIPFAVAASCKIVNFANAESEVFTDDLVRNIWGYDGRALGVTNPINYRGITYGVHSEPMVFLNGMTTSKMQYKASFLSNTGASAVVDVNKGGYVALTITEDTRVSFVDPVVPDNSTLTELILAIYTEQPHTVTLDNVLVDSSNPTGSPLQTGTTVFRLMKVGGTPWRLYKETHFS